MHLGREQLLEKLCGEQNKHFLPRQAQARGPQRQKKGEATSVYNRNVRFLHILNI